jgi:tetratricopeptide (TPR) repeat protein
MNTKIARIITALVMLAAWPAVSHAQTVVRVPPASIQIPATSIQVPPVVVQIPDIQQLGTLRVDQSTAELKALLDAARSTTDRSAELMAELALQQQTRPTAPVIAGRLADRVYLVESGSYEAGLSALDNEQWQRAAELFERVIKAGKTRVDGATYWKAYALDRLGQRSDALTALQDLMKAYPNSRYLDDARALEMEVRKGAGQAVKPEEQANEDLKLMALTSVMQADPERATPLVEQTLKGHNSLKIKQRALFLLSTSESPRARDVLAAIARGGANPDLQLKAIRYLGMRRSSNAQLLADVYASSRDSDVKREIIRSLMMARDVDRLLNIAKTEPSPELRIEAIRQLGTMRADNQLSQLYSEEKVAEIREQIVRSMVMSGNAERAAELAKREADAAVRASAVRNLGTMDRAKTGEALVQIYRSDKDQGVKKAVIGALYTQQNAKALVDLARQEPDMAMKREIVSRLSTMKAKEATDYMLELLK